MVQAKDVDGDELVELILQCNEARCDFSPEAAERGWGSFHGGRPGYAEGEYDPPVGHYAHFIDLYMRVGSPPKVVRAKLKRLIEQGRITGCVCGCRGEFEVRRDPGQSM